MHETNPKKPGLQNKLFYILRISLNEKIAMKTHTVLMHIPFLKKTNQEKHSQSSEEISYRSGKTNADYQR